MTDAPQSNLLRFAVFRRLVSPPLPELLIILLALAIRLWRLEYHSIWFDEAVSLSWAGADPGYTWKATFQLVQEKHPPLYYIGLHYWQQTLALVGLARNDAALRAFGSLLGALTVWGILLLAQRLSGRVTGWLTAALAALSPALVWYSQEVRMFQPATTAIVWAAYCSLRGWQTTSAPARLGWWAGYVLTMEAALYSYLFSAFMLPAASLALLALFWRQRERQRFYEGIIALAVTGLLFLPLARNAWFVNASESKPGAAFANFSGNVGKLLQIFTVWRVEWPAPFLIGALALLAFLATAGLLLPCQDAKNQVSASNSVLGNGDSLERVWLAVWIGAPLLTANILLSRSHSIFDEDRYLLFMAPFVLWAIARGVITLGQRVTMFWLSRIAGLAALLLVAAALPRLWSPAMYRENWRAAATYILDYEQKSPGLPGAAVAHVDYTHQALEWYLRPAISFGDLPVFFPFGGQLTSGQMEEVIAPPLEGLVAFGAATLWLTQSHLAGVDDERLVEGWLNQHFPVSTEQYPAGVKLSGYMLRYRFQELPTLSAAAVYPDAELTPGLKLAACEILTPKPSPRDQQMHPPSGWVHLRLWWQAAKPISQDYVAAVQMIGPEGVWGERLWRENEALRRFPTSQWVAGEFVRDEVDVNLNPLTPNGEYPVVVGLMESDGEIVGGRVECGRVRIM